MMSTSPDWLDWVRRMQAIAQNGLTFARDPFDRERYEALRALSAEMLTRLTAGSLPDGAEALARSFTSGSGYATPKLDVRAAVFRADAEPRILLVKERSDGGWTLPGGWVDVGEAPSVAVAKEVREESGYEVRATRVLALLDRDRHAHPPMAEHVWKLFLRCEVVGESRAPGGDGLETDGAAFFTERTLPPLSLPRVTPAQIARLFAHYRDPSLPADFD